jgi:hypothetical protein
MMNPLASEILALVLDLVLSIITTLILLRLSSLMVIEMKLNDDFKHDPLSPIVLSSYPMCFNSSRYDINLILCLNLFSGMRIAIVPKTSPASLGLHAVLLAVSRLDQVPYQLRHR